MPTTTLSEPELLPEDVELERLLALKLALPSEAHSNIHRMYNSIMFDDKHPFPFASMQIQHHIEEYWSKTYGQGKDDTLFMAAYRAGLYTADSTANEIFLSAMRYIGQVGAIHFQSEHLNSLQLLADFNHHETEIVVCAADWILAADVITKEQYAQVVRMIFVERLDLDPSAFNDTINNFIGDLEYYEHKHFVAVNKQMEVYSIIRHSHLSSEYSETRALAVALARAGAGAPLEQVEETTNNYPISIEVSPLCIDHYEGGEFGEKDWAQFKDVKKEEHATLEIMTSCYEMTMMTTNDGGSQLCGGYSANMDVRGELNDGTGAFRNEEGGGGGMIDEGSRGEMRTTGGGGVEEYESNTCIGLDKYEDVEAITMNDHPIRNETSASAPNIGGRDCEAEVNEVDFTVALEEDVNPMTHASNHVWNNEGGGEVIADANDCVGVSKLYEGTISGGGHADGVHASLRNGTVKADWLMYDILRVGENAKIRPDTNKYEDGEGLDDLCLDGCNGSSNRREAHLSLVSSSRHFPPKGKGRALKESLAFEKGSLLPNAVRSIQAGILTIVMFVKYLAGLISMVTFVKNGCHKPGNQVRIENDRPSKIPAAFASNGGLVAGKHSTYQIAESDVSVRENCALGSNDYFWQLIGLAEIVFLAIVTVLTRFAEGKAVSVEGINKSQEKRIKTFTCVHRGRLNCNYLFRVVFYFLLANTAQATSRSDFAWTHGSDLDYTDFCDVRSGTWSCICITGSTVIMNEGKNSYYICDKNCLKPHYRVKGYCAQCAAGKFWGNYYSEGESKYQLSNVDCPDHDADTCTCGTTTHSPDSDSTSKYYFKYVCNHNANSDGVPMNQVEYSDIFDISQGTTKCSTCPAGTYSTQGDMVCKPCEAGRYSSSDGSSQCTPCPPGQYSDDTGFTSCKVCNAGTSSNAGKDAYGSTQCDNCAPGYYESSSGSSGCDFCPAGHYTNSDSGATDCTAASAGYYVGATNGYSLPYLNQYECPIGSYSSTTGQSYCTSCPPNTSTYDPGSTSLSDCISCPYGVDANTFACIKTPSTQLNNVCWDASQLLSLGASSAVADLDNLVYNLPEIGMNALISDAMSVIEEAAKGISSIEEIQTVLDKLKNAEEKWLGGLSDNFDSCVASTSDEIINVANTDVQHNTNLFQYQFGDSYAHDRAEWIAQWRCKGATFGCTSFDTTGCPQAQTCFAPLYKYFGPFLSYAGGTVFGNYQQLITGRYTPRYSPSFISTQLEENVKSLVQWVNAATSFQRYYNITNQIQDSEQFTAEAINAVLQVQTVSASVSLDSSYTEGNLYYEQAQYNYNETFDIAQIVQYGPAFCPNGYEITADGIPNGCTDYATLVKECQREILFDAAMKLISDTMKLAAGLVQPLPGGASAGAIAAFKGFNAIANLASLSTTLLQQPWSAGSLWDPTIEMPTLPVSSADGSFADEQYADASYQWYLDGQQNISDSLIVWSPARWDAIYLENEKQYGPTVLNPPNCPNHKSKIVTALNDYLINVESMSNYGSSMTAALMSLVPAMGNIAAGIATQAAIANAGKEISGMVKTPNPSLGETAPPEYQNVYEQLFFTQYKDTSDAILAYAPSASLAQQQYVAAKSIFGFCTSYSYMNAGLDYENTFDGKTANCKEFGSLYLPTYETFEDTVNSFVDGTFSSIESPPVLVSNLNKNIEDFAANVNENPEAVGQTQQDIIDNVNTFTLEFAYDPNSTSTTSYYGNLTDGKIRFTLTASSILLLDSNYPFTVFDTNARVINVQTFWRGVTSPPLYNQFTATTINPIGPNMVYLDPSGEGTTFNLPPYSHGSSSSNSVFFAQFRSIQDQNECGTGINPVGTSWRNGEHLQFCTPYASDLQQPFTGIANYAFLFPSMWTTWEVEADHDQWKSGYFNINETELALQVMFRYVASPNPSQAGGPDVCAMNCGVGLPTRDNVPLLGEEWCDRKACSDCVASHSYNGTQLTTDPFCRCNVWDGTHETCTPSTTTTDSFTFAFSNSNRRRRLKKKKAKNGIESESETGKAGKSGAEAKSGKSEMMSEMALGLRELLQTYLKDCDGNAADGIGGNALVQIGECKKKGKKRHNCDFHLSVPAYEGEAESIKNEANACIVAMLGEDAVKEAIAEFLSSCDVAVYRNVDSNKMIKKWNLCSLLE